LLRLSLTEYPSIRWHYPASSVLCTSPPPHTARPVSGELPVDPYGDRWSFPCCVWSPMHTCHRHYPGRFNGVCSSISIASDLPPCRLLQLFFRGRLSVHSRYDLHARGVAKRLFTRRSDSFVASAGASISGRANQFPGVSCTC
jgi:hypothetical protein